MDFTVKQYRKLLTTLKNQEYDFQTFEEYIASPKDRMIILRHDVDLLPNNSLNFAEIQHELGIRGTYYFRAVPESWDEVVIKKIAAMGHEIGYHYECLTTCKGDMTKGIQDFEKNLKLLRELAPVSTICMHGSPMSKHDSKDLWKSYNYQDYRITGEPYFDVNFNEVYYLTDTGRKWDGNKVSVRDRVDSSFNLSFHTTQDIIKYAVETGLPNRIMFTFHPQRWNDNLVMWTKEIVLQNVKNVVKKMFFVKPNE